VALMLYGPDKAMDAYHMSVGSAVPGGVLNEHWRHLQRAMLMPLAKVAPPDIDAEPVAKVRWVQRKLFNMCFSIDETPEIDAKEDAQGYVNVLRGKNSILSSLLGSVRLEAELMGHLESAKLKAKRQVERESAQEEDVMPEEQRLQLYRATLRAKGYEVSKIVEREPDIEVTRENDDAQASAT